MFAELKPTANAAEPVVGVASDFEHALSQTFEHYDGPNFSIRFWDNSLWFRESTEEPTFEIWLRNHNACCALTSHPDEVSLETAYIQGDLYVNGDLFQAVRALPFIRTCVKETSVLWPVTVLQEARTNLKEKSSRLLRWGAEHSRTRDAAAIASHYNKPAEFYRAFLGRSLVYSCGYFQSWEEDINAAQESKMDLICRKLDLKPGDRFLDIGCGWGTLVLHATQKYGASGHGISLSQEQVEYAQEEIDRRHLGERCAVYHRDFRDLGVLHLPFAKVASVGMCEHVGAKHIDGYFADVYRTMVPGGLFLNHGITCSPAAPSKGPSFINTFVFPDGELLSVSQLLQAAEKAGFEVRDVEDLREHYEKTLHLWLEALDAHEEQILSRTDKHTFRIWKLYMTGSAEAFRRGDIAIHQLLLSKNNEGRSSSMKNRRAWYASEPVAQQPLTR